MTCADCKFFHDTPLSDSEFGFCRRHPPTVVHQAMVESSKAKEIFERLTLATWFPAVSPADWCGEWTAQK